MNSNQKTKQPPKAGMGKEDKKGKDVFRKAAEKAQKKTPNGVVFDTYEPMMHVGA